jgi:hypothetical protein
MYFTPFVLSVVEGRAAKTIAWGTSFDFAQDERVTGIRIRPDRITGTTALSTFRIGNPDMGGSLNMQQGAALFRWDDQQAYGMVERSTAAEKTVVG